MDNCYVILESMYIKYPIGDEIQLKHIESDHLFKYGSIWKWRSGYWYG